MPARTIHVCDSVPYVCYCKFCFAKILFAYDNYMAQILCKYETVFQGHQTFNLFNVYTFKQIWIIVLYIDSWALGKLYDNMSTA